MATVSFSGLASGLDTDSILEAMLMNYQNKIDKEQQDKAQLQYKQEAWESMNKRINAFYNTITQMRFSSDYGATKATSSSSAITVNTTSSTPKGAYSIEVQELAKGATVSGKITEMRLTTSSKLSQLGIEKDTSIELRKSDGTQVSIAISANETIDDLKSKLQAEGIELSLDVDNNKLSLKGTDMATTYELINEDSNNKALKSLGFGSGGVTLTGGKTEEGSIVHTVLSKETQLKALNSGIKAGDKLMLNGINIEISEDETLATLEKKLKAADPSLNINLDADNKMLFISTTQTGKDEGIKIDSNNVELLKTFGFSESGVHEAGTDAIYKYNGVTLTSSSNTIEVGGINMTLNEKTTQPVNVEVSADTEKAATMISDFVEAYNSLLKDIDEQLNVTKSGLKPLTEAEKEDMTASEIEKYEDKLKKEALAGDPTLKMVRDNLRQALQKVVPDNSEYKVLSAVGITTGEWRENGKLHLDEEKLKKALENNYDEVMSLFTTSSEKDEKGGVIRTGGAITNLYDTYASMRKRIDSVKSVGSYYNDYLVKESITSANEAINKAKEKYEVMRKIYEAKFTAMEKALSTMNSQGSAISGMFAL